MIHFIEQYNVYSHLTAFLIGMPRIFVVALIVPFLGTNVLEGPIWFILAFAIYLPLHPAIVYTLNPEIVITLPLTMTLILNIVYILIKESVIGLFLGILAGFPFWALQDAGSFIDNQRGASQAEESDILTGKSVTPTGAILLETLIYIFYASGSFVLFLGLLYTSYERWPASSAWINLKDHMHIPIFIAGQLSDCVKMVILYAAPITIACLLLDIALALINRFAPQLNAYVIAMPLKSGVAFFLLPAYLLFVINKSPFIFHLLEESFSRFANMIGAVHG